jgi:hypothetical protein
VLGVVLVVLPRHLDKATLVEPVQQHQLILAVVVVVVKAVLAQMAILQQAEMEVLANQVPFQVLLSLMLLAVAVVEMLTLALVVQALEVMAVDKPLTGQTHLQQIEEVAAVAAAAVMLLRDMMEETEVLVSLSSNTKHLFNPYLHSKVLAHG